MRNKVYNLLSLRYFLSILLIISSVGKIQDLTETAVMVNQLFELSFQISKIVAFLMASAEFGFILLIWQPVVPAYLIFIPLIFLIIQIFTYIHEINCGCFGKLPFFSELPYDLHSLLIFIIFVCLLLLIRKRKIIKNVGKIRLYKIRAYFSNNFTIIIIFVCCVLITILLSSLFPKKNKNVIYISKLELAVAVKDKDTILIDSRPFFQYKNGHIENAINVPFNLTDSAILSAVISNSLKSKTIIVYCSNSKCNSSNKLIIKLKKFGCKKIYHYLGGWKDWNKSQTK